MQDVRQREMAGVTAAVVENFWAGVGLAVVLYVAGFFWRGHSDALLTVAGLSGAALFGLLCVLRFSEELKERIDQEVYVRTVSALQAEIDGLRAELAHVNTEKATAEFAAATKSSKTVVVADKDAQLKRDLREIVDRWAANARYGRDHCGMGRPRWEAATSFLVECGVMVVEGKGSRQQRVFVDGLTRGDVDRKIAKAFKRIAETEGTNFAVPLS
jgi:hypothetical protein